MLTNIYISIFQTLKAEFDHHDNLLKELEAQVDNYNEKGNSEVASRLQQQISLLKVRKQYLTWR